MLPSETEGDILREVREVETEGERASEGQETALERKWRFSVIMPQPDKDDCL